MTSLHQEFITLVKSPLFWLVALICILLIDIAMKTIRKLNINKWLWIGLVFPLIVATVVSKFLNQEIFWGVFVATLLSFIASVCIEKWLEEKSNLKADEEENFEKRRAISLLIREIAENKKTADQISSYFGTVLSASETDLMARSTDGFYLRFQTASKTALWETVTQVINDEGLTDKVGVLYSNYEYCNRILLDVSKFITEHLQIGAIPSSYRHAVTALPWTQQLQNTLGNIINESTAIEESLKIILNQLQK